MSFDTTSMPTLSSVINHSGLTLHNPDHVVEVLRQLVNGTFEQLKLEDWDLAEWSDDGKVSHRHKCSWNTDALIALTMFAHMQMSRICSHVPAPDDTEDPDPSEFYCDPPQSTAEAEGLMDELLEHFDAVLAFMKSADAPPGGPSAMAYLHTAVAKFSNSRHYHDRCLKPLWQFLLEFTSILYDLQLADETEKPFETIHHLKTTLEFLKDIGKKPLSRLAPIPPEERDCSICLDRFHTFDELVQHQLFEVLPFNLRAGVDDSIDNPDIGDIPYRTTCGHTIGFYCFKTSVIESVRGKKALGICPMCRSPLVREHCFHYKAIESIGVEGGFVTN